MAITIIDTKDGCSSITLPKSGTVKVGVAIAGSKPFLAEELQRLYPGRFKIKEGPNIDLTVKAKEPVRRGRRR